MPDITTIGFILLVAGIILIIAGSLSAKESKIAVGGFIGPFPFGWANDPAMLKWIIALTAVVAIIFLILVLRGFVL